VGQVRLGMAGARTVTRDSPDAGSPPRLDKLWPLIGEIAMEHVVTFGLEHRCWARSMGSASTKSNTPKATRT
jgi:hypothetical protein